MSGNYLSAVDAALLIFVLMVGWSLYRAQRDPNVDFNLFDLIMENGKVSRIAFAFLTALIATTWVLIKVAQDGKMTDLLYAAYGTMWVAPICAKMFSSNPSVPPKP